MYMSKYFCVCVSVHHMHVATTRPEEGLGPPGDGVPAAWSYHVGAGFGTWVRAVKHSLPPLCLYIFAGFRILHLTDWHASGIQIILTLSQGLKNNQIFQLGLCSASLIIVTVLGTHIYWPPWRKELDLQVRLVWGGGGETCACFSDSPEGLWLYVFPIENEKHTFVNSQSFKMFLKFLPVGLAFHKSPWATWRTMAPPFHTDLISTW